MSHQFVDPMPFPLNVSSYFKRPTKIVKPNSRGDSPKNLSRRKTTASHSLQRRRTPGVGGPQRHGGPIGAARPISWHPNTMSREATDAWSRLQPFPDSAYSMQMPVYPFSTTQVNGLITPLSLPSSGGSCYDETFTSLDDTHMSNTCSPCPFPAPVNYESLWSTPNPTFPRQNGSDSLDFSHVYHRLSQPQQAYLPTHLYKDTAPPTPEITPAVHGMFIKDEPKEKMDTAEPEGEVLVGMGLYDGPLSLPAVMSGATITLPNRASAGKGLILEETFEPSAEEEGNEDGDGDEDDEEVEEIAEPKVEQVAQDTKPVPVQQSAFRVEKPLPAAQPLASGSFFFDNDSQDHLVQDLNAYFANPVWNGHNNGQTWI